MQKIIKEFIESLNRPATMLNSTNNPFEISVFVFENENVQFITNNLQLCGRVAQKYHLQPEIMDSKKLKFNTDLNNCLFVEDDTVENYWLHGLIDNCLAIILTKEPERLKPLLDTMVERHFSEFQAIYSENIKSDNLPKIKINAAIDGKVLFRGTNPYSTRSDIENCQRFIYEMIEKSKEKHPDAPILANSNTQH